jgi:hypothetical protein
MAKKKIPNGRAAWWTRRKAMYDFVIHRKHIFMTENPGSTESDAEAKAIREGEEIFNSVPFGRSGHRKIDDINDAFRRALGIKYKKGRPRKRPPNRDRFAAAFDNIPIDPTVMADLATESTDDE